MEPSLHPPCADDPEGPELRYYNLMSELDALTLYLVAVAWAADAPIIHVSPLDLESRTAWRRWGPEDRSSADRNRRERRSHGRRYEDRLPSYARF